MHLPPQLRPTLPAQALPAGRVLDIDLGAPPLDIDLQALAEGALVGRLFDALEPADSGRPSSGWRTQPAVHYVRLSS
jgi:hypothetical protein